jgi:hypothetical protein
VRTTSAVASASWARCVRASSGSSTSMARCQPSSCRARKSHSTFCFSTKTFTPQVRAIRVFIRAASACQQLFPPVQTSEQCRRPWRLLSPPSRLLEQFRPQQDPGTGHRYASLTGKL